MNPANSFPRHRKTTLKDEHIAFFHSILTWVECDDENLSMGSLNWSSLKSVMKDRVTFMNITRDMTIDPSHVGDESICFKEKNQIARNFVKALRNAFAHNRIIYDEKKDEFFITLRNHKDKSLLRLCARLRVETLRAIVDELEKQFNISLERKDSKQV